jgi:hypothetical protein
MNRIACSFTTIALVMAASFSVPVTASAEPQERVLLWMAASSSEPTIASEWGRLTIKNGVLAFAGTGVEWQVPIADIRRASISDESEKLIVIETVRDEKYYVAILGPNMLVETPRKALDDIKRAQRPSAGRR